MAEAPNQAAAVARGRPAPTEKRRAILDAAIRVFARQGYHATRVSDIADEAGVAYGLVYHYFSSKEQMLDTVFLGRWDVMLAAIAEADAAPLSAAAGIETVRGGGQQQQRRRLPSRALPAQLLQNRGGAFIDFRGDEVAEALEFVEDDEVRLQARKRACR